ncbi:MAG: class I SAM-dependent methyltransferase [Candidatus Humimicrobiaceae bacterium]
MEYTIELARRIIDDAGLDGTEREVEIPFIFDNMPNPPAKLLDVGCSYSQFLLEMDRLGFDAYGIDVNDYGVEYSKFIKADARHIPFEDKTFDVVTCISALEHYGLVETPYGSDTVYDPEAPFTALREMTRVIKDDGMIILTLPYGYTENKDWLKWVKFYNADLIKQLIGVTDLFIFKQQIKACINNLWIDISEKEGEKILSTDKVNCNISLVLRK